MTKRDGFTDLESRAQLRDMIGKQVLGRYRGDGGDEPLPHIMTKMLDQIDDLEDEVKKLRGERDAARLELAHRLNVGRNVTDACSAEWETCWCDTCKQRRGEG